MATVKFLDLDVKTRMATFDVDGKEVSRQVTDNYLKNGQTIDQHLQALADGLSIEFGEESVIDEVMATSLAKGAVLT